MSMVTEDTDRWLVSARANGELLASRAVVPGLELQLLGRVEGYTAAELESWLLSLAQAVRDNVGGTPPGDPVPPMLREALGGLLFSRAELWTRGDPPCAIALVGTPDRIGFGWVGEASVEVYRDGARDGSEWVSIRDAQGREARAWCGSPRHDVRVELAWSPGPGDELVRLEAHWSVASPADSAREPAAADDRPASAPSQPPTASLEDAPLDTDSPSSGVARWLAQHLKW